MERMYLLLGFYALVSCFFNFFIGYYTGRDMNWAVQRSFTNITDVVASVGIIYGVSLGM